MNRGILDTSVLVAADVAPIPGELAISVLNIAELQFGVLVARTPEARAHRLARLSALQRRFDPLPVDDAVADSYGRLAARVVDIGHQPRARTMDLLIAATAHAHEASVYPHNAADLADLADLITIVTIRGPWNGSRFERRSSASGRWPTRRH
ncbi:PIN domain-containing protein [Frankia sp. AiPs1]|nr:PIN domain-containing protein [Frankia sp. AiPs1]MCM3921757.1 PIN domain-containing protein [Frankia sp. AiPs1]